MKVDLKVELIFDPDCPNVIGTRRNLTVVFQKLELKPEWKEWNQQESGAPDYVYKFGSPTVLINGKDILSTGCDVKLESCRLYEDSHGNVQRFPSVDLILSTIKSL